MERNDIFVSIRPKPKQANKSVIIKSVEGNVQRMFEGRKELLGLKTSGLEQITFLPSLAHMANNFSSATSNASNHCFTFKNNNDDILSRHGGSSGSSYGYHSSEENSLCHENNMVKMGHPTPIQRPSPRDSPGSSTSGHYSDSMGGSECIRKTSHSPTSSIEALEHRLGALTTSNSAYDNAKLWENAATNAVNKQQQQQLGATMNANQFTNHLQHSFTSNEYARLGQMALQAMARPVLAPEIQTPTSAWAGLGFSRSMNSADINRYYKILLKINSKSVWE